MHLVAEVIRFGRILAENAPLFRARSLYSPRSGSVLTQGFIPTSTLHTANGRDLFPPDQLKNVTLDGAVHSFLLQAVVGNPVEALRANPDLVSPPLVDLVCGDRAEVFLLGDDDLRTAQTTASRHAHGSGRGDRRIEKKRVRRHARSNTPTYLMIGA